MFHAKLKETSRVTTTVQNKRENTIGKNTEIKMKGLLALGGGYGPLKYSIVFNNIRADREQSVTLDT